MAPATQAAIPQSPVGAVFTPATWAQFAIREFGIFEKWMEGKRILDPTMGDGGLLAALIQYGLDKGYTPQQLPLKNLAGLEVHPGFYASACGRLHQLTGGAMPMENLGCGDLFFLRGEPKCDVLFGNPPWVNFNDLEAAYKDQLKPVFVRYGLAKRGASLLLGNSRVDLAALVVQKTIAENLATGGEAFYFLPLSLLLNEGASAAFRQFSAGKSRFCVKKVYDLTEADAFPGVSTRYGLLHLQRDAEQEFPVPVLQYAQHQWNLLEGNPQVNPQDAWMFSPAGTPALLPSQIEIAAQCKPRQGINTCGANSIFYFQQIEPAGNNLLSTEVEGRQWLLPAEFIYPVLSPVHFRKTAADPAKWVLLPYDRNGKPLEEAALEREPHLKEYLIHFRERLTSRKGVLIQSAVRKGYWYSLLGVGPYCFAPWKVVWEAYGRSEFRPVIVEGHWQVNQSLQAFVPAWTREEAVRIHRQLSQPQVEQWLLQQGGAGTMNWAQPGRMMKLMKIAG